MEKRLDSSARAIHMRLTIETTDKSTSQDYVDVRQLAEKIAQHPSVKAGRIKYSVDVVDNKAGGKDGGR